MRVIRFTADWCAPCKQLTPLFDQLRKENPHIEFQEINVDDNRETVVERGVRQVPTVIFEVNGMEVDRAVGLEPRETYETILRTYYGKR